MTDLLAHIRQLTDPSDFPRRRETFVVPDGPETLQAEVERLRETITATVAIFDGYQNDADLMVMRGMRRGAANSLKQSEAARAMVKLLRAAVSS